MRSKPPHKPRPHQRHDPVHSIVPRLWAELDPLSDKGRKRRVFASDLLAETFRVERDLDDAQRGEITQALYGMLRHARKLEFALTNATEIHGKPARRPRELAFYLAWQVLEKQLTPERAADLLGGFDWPAVLRVNESISRVNDAAKRLALTHSLPNWLAERIQSEYGADADAIASALNQPAPQTLRANLLKASRDEIIAALNNEGIDARATSLSSTAIELPEFAAIFRSQAFKDGLIEVQDEASQLVAELVMPSPNSIVIDACAGAGGKTLALGALMRGKGRLLALDVSTKRLEELRKRARRAGLSNARAIELTSDHKFPAEVEALKGKADRVLVDAPCSGIGALRRNPDAKWNLSEDALKELPEEQESIARRAMELCAPNGRLIYATCTILHAENEAVVQRLLENHAFSLVPIKEILGKKLAEQIADPSGHFLKLLPHKHNTDGFFAAVLRRAKKT